MEIVECPTSTTRCREMIIQYTQENVEFQRENIQDKDNRAQASVVTPIQSVVLNDFVGVSVAIVDRKGFVAA